MSFHYTSETHVQMLISLLKANGISKIVASPGAQIVEFIASVQQDPFFEIFSCVDERSAAYMACGISAETNEPVVIICTEATASRNYFSALTEAYHRKLPILAITCLHSYAKIGHLHPQVINRDGAPSDSIKWNADIPLVTDNDTKWQTNIIINEALLELNHHGRGPVHLNLPSSKVYNLSVTTLPEFRCIKRYECKDQLPDMPTGRIAVFIGSHPLWSEEETKALEAFCEAHDAVVFCDHTSQYKGKYAVHTSLMGAQSYTYDILTKIDTLIHIGEETGDTFTMNSLKVNQVYRVSEDGKIRDTFKKLTAVFEMPEHDFFAFYAKSGTGTGELKKYIESYEKDKAALLELVPELPFSNLYIASKVGPVLPQNSLIHVGLSNSIRAWLFFDIPHNVRLNSNVGCRGIDGCVSAMIGASLVNKDQLVFGVFGDLTFFYDMNALGNRHIGQNLRIMLINNSGGNIFKHNEHQAHKKIGNEAVNIYVAAGGHFGNKSPDLIRHYAEDLGFEYISASDKTEFSKNLEKFIDPHIGDRSIIFEVFTNDEDEIEAFTTIKNLQVDTKVKAKGKAIEYARNMLGTDGINAIKKLIK